MTRYSRLVGVAVGGRDVRDGERGVHYDGPVRKPVVTGDGLPLDV